MEGLELDSAGDLQVNVVSGSVTVNDSAHVEHDSALTVSTQDGHLIAGRYNADLTNNVVTAGDDAALLSVGSDGCVINRPRVATATLTDNVAEATTSVAIGDDDGHTF